MQLVNSVLNEYFTGAFHCGVEVYRREWSFCGSGIFSCPPSACEGHTYIESEIRGLTAMSEDEVMRLLFMMQERCWDKQDYSGLDHNCIHFCEDLCLLLGVGYLPERVKNLAAKGVAVRTAINDQLLSCTQRNNKRLRDFQSLQQLRCCCTEDVLADDLVMNRIGGNLGVDMVPALEREGTIPSIADFALDEEVPRRTVTSEVHRQGMSLRPGVSQARY